MKNFRAQHRPKKSSMVIGREKVLKAMETGQALDRIYLDNKAQGAEINQIRTLATEHKIPINYVPQAKLNGFNVTDHEGCIALLAKVQYQDLTTLLSFIIDKGEAPLLLILDGITDIRNIGGIARTAYCCGVHALVIPDKGVGALNEDAILTSAGALEKIPVCRVNSLMKTVDELHQHGVTVFATEMEATKTIDTCDFTVPAAIVMGSEEKGIYPALLKICDEKVRIPMVGDFESLNVSVATGIVLYEAMKQRL